MSAVSQMMKIASPRLATWNQMLKFDGVSTASPTTSAVDSSAAR
jgi:hypothetical protein